MKGDVVSVLVYFQKFIKFQSRLLVKYLVEMYSQGVLTLHLLTITLRRNIKPPGFFASLVMADNCF